MTAPLVLSKHPLLRGNLRVSRAILHHPLGSVCGLLAITECIWLPACCLVRQSSDTHPNPKM
eukprot:4001287-Amphidinium_carterae.1